MARYSDAYVQDLENEVEYLRQLVEIQERTISGLNSEIETMDRIHNRAINVNQSYSAPTPPPRRKSGKRLLDRVSVTIDPGHGFEIQIED